jgi:hypothetical protein
MRAASSILGQSISKSTALITRKFPSINQSEAMAEGHSQMLNKYARLADSAVNQFGDIIADQNDSEEKKGGLEAHL